MTLYYPDLYHGRVFIDIVTHQPDGQGRTQTGQVFSGSKGLFTVSCAARRIAADPNTVWCRIVETQTNRLLFSHSQEQVADRDLVPVCPSCGPLCAEASIHFFSYQMWEQLAELVVPARWTRLMFTAPDSAPVGRCPDALGNYIAHDSHAWANLDVEEKGKQMFCPGLTLAEVASA